jgi:hypothetical protein
MKDTDFWGEARDFLKTILPEDFQERLKKRN